MILSFVLGTLFGAGLIELFYCSGVLGKLLYMTYTVIIASLSYIMGYIVGGRNVRIKK